MVVMWLNKTQYLELNQGNIQETSSEPVPTPMLITGVNYN